MYVWSCRDLGLHIEHEDAQSFLLWGGSKLFEYNCSSRMVDQSVAALHSAEIASKLDSMHS